jgi:peptidoglycan/xylan/chitin deacetylase (PgdA/CDA1 family)
MLTRIEKFIARNLAKGLYRRQLNLRLARPIVSFTFDDFPSTALQTGGAILKEYGARGTYYVSMGLVGKESPSGLICSLDEIQNLAEDGHELGCHTYSHCHSWNTPPERFEEDIVKNQAALQEILPHYRLETLSYPISEPRPDTKRRAGNHFRACRAGGQTLNQGRTDLNQLYAYFLEQSGENLAAVNALIAQCLHTCGWLILATHDVQEKPSPYGCSPRFFEDVVQSAAESGAQILPVAEALNVIQSKAAAAH